jgi:hypothetical protein
MTPLSLLAIVVSMGASGFSLVWSFTRPSRRRSVVMNLTYQTSDGKYDSVEGVTVPEPFANAVIKKLKRAKQKREQSAPGPETA